jgi:hypothetical protein
MKSTLSPLLVSTLLACAAAGASWAGSPACPQPASAALTGLWESPSTSRGGIGQTLEFRRDGTFVQSTTVLVNSRYETAGDRLTVTVTPPDPGGAMEFKLRVEGDRLIETMNGIPPFDKERVGKAEAGAPPIVGVWRSGQAGMVAYEKYTQDGRMLFRTTLASFTGCYKVQGDRLTLVNPGGKEATMPFHLRSGELVVDDPGGQPYTYKLSPDGPWYDREHPPGAPR